MKITKNSLDAFCEVFTTFSKEIETETENMKNSLNKLHEYYRDEGYTSHETNMNLALKSMNDVCDSMQTTVSAVKEYGIRLFDAT